MRFLDNRNVSISTKENEVFSLCSTAFDCPILRVLSIKHFFSLPVVRLEQVIVLFLDQDRVHSVRFYEQLDCAQSLALLFKFQSREVQENDVALLRILLFLGDEEHALGLAEKDIEHAIFVLVVLPVDEVVRCYVVADQMVIVEDNDAIINATHFEVAETQLHFVVGLDGQEVDFREFLVLFVQLLD